jgi:hypothetical protein
VALMRCVIHEEAPLEWRAASDEADLEVRAPAKTQSIVSVAPSHAQ